MMNSPASASSSSSQAPSHEKQLDWAKVIAVIYYSAIPFIPQEQRPFSTLSSSSRYIVSQIQAEYKKLPYDERENFKSAIVASKKHHAIFPFVSFLNQKNGDDYLNGESKKFFNRYQKLFLKIYENLSSSPPIPKHSPDTFKRYLLMHNFVYQFIKKIDQPDSLNKEFKALPFNEREYFLLALEECVRSYTTQPLMSYINQADRWGYKYHASKLFFERHRNLLYKLYDAMLECPAEHMGNPELLKSYLSKHYFGDLYKHALDYESQHQSPQPMRQESSPKILGKFTITSSPIVPPERPKTPPPEQPGPVCFRVNPSTGKLEYILPIEASSGASESEPPSLVSQFNQLNLSSEDSGSPKPRPRGKP